MHCLVFCIFCIGSCILVHKDIIARKVRSPDACDQRLQYCMTILDSASMVLYLPRSAVKDHIIRLVSTLHKINAGVLPQLIEDGSQPRFCIAVQTTVCEMEASHI